MTPISSDASRTLLETANKVRLTLPTIATLKYLPCFSQRSQACNKQPEDTNQLWYVYTVVSQYPAKTTASDLGAPYTSLSNRFLNIHKPHHEAHTGTEQQFLSPAFLLNGFFTSAQRHALFKWGIIRPTISKLWKNLDLFITEYN